MFRSGISSFLKAGVLSDTSYLENRHCQKRQFLCYNGDIDLENFAFSDDDATSLASDDAEVEGGSTLLDEMDEEGEENEIDEDDEEGAR